MQFPRNVSPNCLRNAGCNACGDCRRFNARCSKDSPANTNTQCAATLRRFVPSSREHAANSPPYTIAIHAKCFPVHVASSQQMRSTTARTTPTATLAGTTEIRARFPSEHDASEPADACEVRARTRPQTRTVFSMKRQVQRPRQHHHARPRCTRDSPANTNTKRCANSRQMLASARTDTAAVPLLHMNQIARQCCRRTCREALHDTPTPRAMSDATPLTTMAHTLETRPDSPAHMMGVRPLMRGRWHSREHAPQLTRIRRRFTRDAPAYTPRVRQQMLRVLGADASTNNE